MLVVPLWAVLIACTHWEVIQRDGWGWVELMRRPTTLGGLYDLAVLDYRVLNPRLGQFATQLAYAFDAVHPVVTPLVELGALALLTALALGRWPSFRRTDDAFAALIVTALVFACTPQIGLMLFYRPFTGNYLVGLAVCALWLLPYRVAVVTPGPPRRWLAPVWLIVGIAAGLCNEHLGLGFLAMAALAVVVVRRDGAAVRGWMIAGLVGFTVGYVVLLTAPSQHLRYNGIADQAGYVQRIWSRGVGNNALLIVRFLHALVPAVPVLVVAAVERWRLGPSPQPARNRWAAGGLALGGVLCVLTVLASPKIGPRLYSASVSLVAVAIAGGLIIPLRTAWARRICGVLAAGTVIYVAAMCLATYRVAGPMGKRRLDAIEHGAGTVVTLPQLPFDGDRYFLGEDLTIDSIRDGVIHDFGLKAIVLVPSP
jgi:hypothetical protein